MTNQDPKALAEAFFDRLLDRQAPNQPARDEYAQQAQIFCGRWLALRRLGLGLPIEHLADQTRLSPRILLFVETGIADETLATDDELARLSQALSAAHGDHTWVRMVLSIAVGQVRTPSEQVMMRVVADLYTAYANERTAPEASDGGD